MIKGAHLRGMQLLGGARKSTLPAPSGAWRFHMARASIRIKKGDCQKGTIVVVWSEKDVGLLWSFCSPQTLTWDQPQVLSDVGGIEHIGLGLDDEGHAVALLTKTEGANAISTLWASEFDSGSARCFCCQLKLAGSRSSEDLQPRARHENFTVIGSTNALARGVDV